MPQKTSSYRPTPTNPNVPAVPVVRESATEDLDEFLDEIDAILNEEETFAVRFRQKGGQ